MDLSEVSTSIACRHPWESVRFRFFRDRLRDAGVLDRPVRVLDVGAGDGWFAARLLDELPPGSAVTCWDSGYESSADSARAIEDRDPRLRCTVSRPTDRFDLVLLLDVLEHVSDDGGFLRSIVDGNLASGGRALVSVPAWPVLFGAHDRNLRHVRRYAPRVAADLLRGAGLPILRRGGLFHTLLAPRALQTVRERLLPGAPAPRHDLGTWRHGPVFTGLVERALSLDAALASAASRAGLELPGLSWWALCSRGAAPSPSSNPSLVPLPDEQAAAVSPWATAGQNPPTPDLTR